MPTANIVTLVSKDARGTQKLQNYFGRLAKRDWVDIRTNVILQNEIEDGAYHDAKDNVCLLGGACQLGLLHHMWPERRNRTKLASHL